MARHQGQPLARALLAAACALAGASGCRKPEGFQLSGTVALAAPLQAKAEAPNTVLFIVAKNAGGVPVAVKRVVNPKFPVSFTLRDEHLLVPGEIPGGPLVLHAEVNTHGQVGAAAKGDMRGHRRKAAKPWDRGVEIVVDQEL